MPEIARISTDCWIDYDKKALMGCDIYRPIRPSYLEVLRPLCMAPGYCFSASELCTRIGTVTEQPVRKYISEIRHRYPEIAAVLPMGQKGYVYTGSRLECLRDEEYAALESSIAIHAVPEPRQGSISGADTHHAAPCPQQGSIPGADTHHDALELQQHSTLGTVADQVPIPRNHDLNVMEHSIPQADAYPTDYAAIYARDARIIRGLVYHVYQTMALHRVIPFYDACNKYDQIMTAILPALDTLRDHAEERCRPLMKDLYESLVQLRRLLREWVADPEVEAVRYKRDALRLIVKIRERLHDMENITFDERVLPFD